MAYTETTTTGWGSRLKGSFSGMGLGLALIVCGTGLLWWNEGNFVAERTAISETGGAAVELADITKVDPAMNGKVVHAVGKAVTAETLSDPYGVSANAIALNRKVEYFQWVEKSKSEKKKKLGGGEETVTTYTYEKQWTGSPVESSKFKDPEAQKSNQNWVRLAPAAYSGTAKEVKFGAYRLPDWLVRSIGNPQPVTVQLTDAQKNALAGKISFRRQQDAAPARQPAAKPNQNAQKRPAAQQAVRRDWSQNAAPQNRPRPAYSYTDGKAGRQAAPRTDRRNMIHSDSNVLYVGPDPANPRVGDVRLTYTSVNPAVVSLIAKVQGDTFVRHTAKNGKTVGKLSMGEHPLDEMIASAQSSNSTMNWVFRVIGTLLVIGGLKAVFAPLAVLGGVIPFVESLLSAGTGLVSTLLGGAWSLLVISVAWIAARPLVAGILVLIAAALVAFAFMKAKAAKKKEAPAA